MTIVKTRLGILKTNKNNINISVSAELNLAYCLFVIKNGFMFIKISLITIKLALHL